MPNNLGPAKVDDDGNLYVRLASGVAIVLTGPFGRAADAASLSVALSTEDVALLDGLETVLGTTAGAAVITDANGTIQQYLRGLVTRWVNALGAGTAAAALRTTLASDDPAVTKLTNGAGANGSATFTPAAASHTAGDCNGAAADFTLGAPSGCRFMITDATLSIAGATAEATAWRLYLYNVTPPSAIADDGAFDFTVATDGAAFLGFIDLGTAADLGGGQYVQNNIVNKVVKLTGTTVFGYLVNLTTLTPAAVAHTVTLIGTPL